MEDLFDVHGNLKIGIHKCYLEEFYKTFVFNFLSTSSRREISVGFARFLLEVLRIYEEFEIWADGSFTTTKTDPGDIDTCTIFHTEQYTSLSHEDQMKAIGLFVGKQTRKKYSVDSYCLQVYPESHPAHHVYIQELEERKKDFTYDSRTGLHKGIIAMKVNRTHVPFLEGIVAEGGGMQ